MAAMSTLLLLLVGGCGSDSESDPTTAAPARTQERGAPAEPTMAPAEIIATARAAGDDDLAEYHARRWLEQAEEPADVAERLAVVIAILIDAGHRDEARAMIGQLRAMASAVPSAGERAVALATRCDRPILTAPDRAGQLEVKLQQQLDAGATLATVRTRLALARVLGELGRPDDARVQLETARDVADAELAGTPMRLARVPILVAQGAWWLAAGDRHSARDLFQEAYGLRLDAAPASAWLHAGFELAYAEFLVVDGRAVEAHDLSRRAVERLVGAFGAETKRVRDAARRAEAADVLPEHDHDDQDDPDAP